MRPRQAWKRFREDNNRGAKDALERRYAHLPAVGEALGEFTGDRLGDFPDYCRRRAMGPPPEPAAPPLAVAALSKEREPHYRRLPRLYVRSPEKLLNLAAEEQHRPVPDPPIVEVDDKTRVVQDIDDSIDDNDREVQEKEAPPPPPDPHRSDRSAPLPAAPVASPHLAIAPPPAPRLVATSELLGYWRTALSAVHRLTSSGSARHTGGTIGLAIGDGRLRLFARDASRAHFATLDAETTGRAEVSLPREWILTKDWGWVGRLEIYSDHARFSPTVGKLVWCPCTAARVPTPPDEPGVGGVVLHRLDILEAVREAVGGSTKRDDLPDEVRLVVDGERQLIVEAPGRRLVRLGVQYAQGEFDVRLGPARLLDSVGCAPADEVTLESLGRFDPLRLESGYFVAVLATRSPEPYL